jgi:hypothetical protein
MSKMTKIALAAAILAATAFSALTAANAQPAATGGTGVPAYDSHGGLVSGDYN